MKTVATKELTKRIKKELTAGFPGVKFSVKQAASYGSLSINWQDGPTSNEVQAKVNRYEGGDFNGMIDLYERKDDSSLVIENGVEWSARYIHYNREMSDETEISLIEWARNYYSDLRNDWDYQNMAWRKFCQTAY